MEAERGLEPFVQGLSTFMRHRPKYDDLRPRLGELLKNGETLFSNADHVRGELTGTHETRAALTVYGMLKPDVTPGDLREFAAQHSKALTRDLHLTSVLHHKGLVMITVLGMPVNHKRFDALRRWWNDVKVYALPRWKTSEN